MELIETFGKNVIPAFDKDPGHSTTHHRNRAEPKFPACNTPPAAISTQHSS